MQQPAHHLRTGPVGDREVKLKIRKGSLYFTLRCVPQGPVHRRRPFVLLRDTAFRQRLSVGLAVVATNPKASDEHFAVERSAELHDVLEILAHKVINVR